VTLRSRTFHGGAGLGVALGALGATLALAPTALANTYVANKLGDHAPNGCTPSDCTLREAITKANNHPGLDTDVLRGGKTYNLRLDNVAGDEDANKTGDLDVLGSLTLRSSNKKLATVDANGIDRVFEVGTSAPVSATFKRVTIRGGDAADSSEHGGGIDSEYGGTLKLVKSKVVGNRTNSEGGGIAADGGTLKVIRSVIARNSATNPSQNAGGIEGEPGSTQNEVILISRSRIVDNHAAANAGGIYAYNRLTINRSTLSGNTSGDAGGAIYNYGTATITKSTIAGNRANTGVGGGIFNANAAGNLILKFSTLSGNVAAGNDGGAIETYGKATLVNDTITKNHAQGNGGGVEADSNSPTVLNAVTIARNTAGTGGGIEGTPLSVSNSLIALNSSSGLGPDCHPGPTIVSTGHNLVGDTTDCGGVFGGSTNDFTNVSPRIAQLADNGGPTKTIALRRHSKAINHAGNDAPSRDQRGVERHNPDIGAYERR
jgi:hypothetical protein